MSENGKIQPVDQRLLVRLPRGRWLYAFSLDAEAWGGCCKNLEDAIEMAFREAADEELEAEYKALAARRVRLGLLLAEIGKRNNIQISQDDISQAVRAQVQNFPGQEQLVYEYYQKNPQALGQLQAPIMEEKVVDFILELAKV